MIEIKTRRIKNNVSEAKVKIGGPRFEVLEEFGAIFDRIKDDDILETAMLALCKKKDKEYVYSIVDTAYEAINLNKLPAKEKAKYIADLLEKSLDSLVADIKSKGEDEENKDE